MTSKLLKKGFPPTNQSCIPITKFPLNVTISKDVKLVSTFDSVPERVVGSNGGCQEGRPGMEPTNYQSQGRHSTTRLLSLDKELVCITAPLIIATKGEMGNGKNKDLISQSEITSSFKQFQRLTPTLSTVPPNWILNTHSTLRYGISSILIIQVRRMALQQILDSKWFRKRLFARSPHLLCPWQGK